MMFKFYLILSMTMLAECFSQQPQQQPQQANNIVVEPSSISSISSIPSIPSIPSTTVDQSSPIVSVAAATAVVDPMSNMEPMELDISEPYLWQMAAFAARQMSEKRLKYKLMTLTSAEKTDTIYRLRLTLKRYKLDEPLSKNDVMYCTVEVIDNQMDGKWEMDNFGCSMPALVRTRERISSSSSSSPSIEISNSISDYNPIYYPSSKPAQTIYEQKYLKPLDNNILKVDNDDLLATESKYLEKRFATYNNVIKQSPTTSLQYGQMIQSSPLHPQQSSQSQLMTATVQPQRFMAISTPTHQPQTQQFIPFRYMPYLYPEYRPFYNYVLID